MTPRRPARPPTLSPLKRALVALDQMQAQLDAAERARHEPIAIVGIGCRFPGGADDPESLLAAAASTAATPSREVPRRPLGHRRVYDPDPDAPGKMSTRRGGFLDDVASFDPQFFGISPREAVSMDPQQRLLLEVAWEALEHAGHRARPARRVSRTGVFVGITTQRLLAAAARRERASQALDAYYASGVRPQHRLGPAVVRPRPAGPEHRARHGLLVVAGRGPPGRAEPARRRVPPGARRRREPDPVARRTASRCRKFAHDGARRPLQDLRRRGRRLRARRGLRRGGAEAAARRGRPTATASWP